MKVEWQPLSAVLRAASRDVTVDSAAAYEMLGMRSFGRGPFAAPTLEGAATSYKAIRLVRTNDLVYPKLMAWEGAFGVVPESLSGRHVSPEFVVFEIDQQLASANYVQHLVSWEGFLEGLSNRSSGTNARRKRLQPRDFLDHLVPMPTIDAQRRIAAHLDRVERLAAHAERGPKRALGALCEQVVERAARTGVRARLGSMVSIERDWFAVDPDASYDPIGVRGFGRGMIRYPAVRGEQLSKLRYYSVVPGRLVISNIKAWEGAVTTSGESDGHRVASNRFLQYRVTDDRASLAWLYLYLTSAAGTRALAAASPGSADRNRTLSMATFEALDVPVPDPEVQNAVEAIASRIEAGENASGRAELLQRALLPAARNEIFSSMR